MDTIIYTGFGFPGRDLMLIRSSDAVVIGCGRIGTIHEFTVAWEANMPLGVLEGEWATDEVIRNIIKSSNRTNPNVIFDKDPKRIVEKLIEMVRKQEGTGEREMRL
jgi:predicted Rossmann-fold nucleotide-binding protein